jgi:ribonuclease VapC
VIIIDSSAIISILFGEPSAPALLARLAADPDRLISVASYLETGTVLAGRRQSHRMRAIDDLDNFLEAASITLAPVDARQARLALRARIQFGRGMGHGGLLNFGDAFSYALALANDAPLLFVGDDFGTTDVVDALSEKEPPAAGA